MGTAGDFDPRKTAVWEVAKFRRAYFWYELKVYSLVALIVGIPFILILWALLEVFGG